jgi:hypothetical protein
MKPSEDRLRGAACRWRQGSRGCVGKWALARRPRPLAPGRKAHDTESDVPSLHTEDRGRRYRSGAQNADLDFERLLIE